jgi:hypothetical protein
MGAGHPLGMGVLARASGARPPDDGHVNREPGPFDSRPRNLALGLDIGAGLGGAGGASGDGAR